MRLLTRGVATAALALCAAPAAWCQSSVLRRSAWEPVSDRGGLTGAVGRWLDFYRLDNIPVMPVGAGAAAAAGARSSSSSTSSSTTGTKSPPPFRVTLPKLKPPAVIDTGSGPNGGGSAPGQQPPAGGAGTGPAGPGTPAPSTPPGVTR